MVRKEGAGREQEEVKRNWKELTGKSPRCSEGMFAMSLPAPRAQVCSAWDAIPAERQYLTATLDSLRTLAGKGAENHDIQDISWSVSSAYRYQTSSTLFKHCGDGGAVTSGLVQYVELAD